MSRDADDGASTVAGDAGGDRCEDEPRRNREIAKRKGYRGRGPESYGSQQPTKPRKGERHRGAFRRSSRGGDQEDLLWAPFASSIGAVLHTDNITQRRTRTGHGPGPHAEPSSVSCADSRFRDSSKAGRSRSRSTRRKHPSPGLSSHSCFRVPFSGRVCYEPRPALSRYAAKLASARPTSPSRRRLRARSRSWRTRSRVTPSMPPISSSVCSRPPSRPK